MASLAIASRHEHADIRKSYHGQVFTLEETTAVVQEFGMPGKDCCGYDRLIEAQVWEMEPLKGLEVNA
jgi:hypothetical protein